MIRGLYTAAIGMTTQQKLMDAVSNNIANVNTTGFKKEQVVTHSFTEELMKRLDDPTDLSHSKRVGSISQGLFVDDIYLDFANGAMKQTGGNLDLAISGYGFFAIDTVDANNNAVVKYTRDGSFTLGADGSLLTKEGNRVMGTDGPIVLPNGYINVDEYGGIFVNNEYVDTLRLVNFGEAPLYEGLHSLRPDGDNLYVTTDESVETAFAGVVVQGYLESSNVNAVKEMVAMISVARAYDANQRIITTLDTTLQRAVNDIGRK